MSVKYDWSQARRLLKRAIAACDNLAKGIGKINLRPGATATELLEQIDEADEKLDEAKAELEAARTAIHAAARARFRVVGAST